MTLISVRLKPPVMLAYKGLNQTFQRVFFVSYTTYSYTDGSTAYTDGSTAYTDETTTSLDTLIP
jgi:hypothetical protein